MVSSISSAINQRATALRRLAEETTGKNAKNDAQIALYDERVQQNLDALDKIGRSRVDAAKKRKELAKQRLEQLKQRLQMLRMMGGSPRSVARQAAAIAKEIASLAREFAAAGSAGTGGFTDGAADAVATSSDGSTENGSGDAEAKADAAIAQQGSDETGDADKQSATAAEPAPQQQAQPHGANASRSNDAADRDGDRAFFRDAQDMLRQLRKLITRAAHDARHKQRGQNAAEIDAADHTAANAERDVATIAAQQSVAAPISIQLTV